MKDITRRRFLIGGSIVGGAVVGVANVAASMFGPMANGLVGAGATEVTPAAGTEGWDTTYVPAATASLADAKAASDVVSEQACDEGIVLLANDGVLPLGEGASVSPYGYGYLNPVYSGTGAAASTDDTQVTPEAGLAAHLSVNPAVPDAMKAAEATFPDAAAGAPALGSGQSGMGGTTDSVEAEKIYSYDTSVYEGLDVADSTAVVFIARNGSEGLDKRMAGYDDGTPHYLALTEGEKAMLAAAKKSCKAVVVVLNTANPVEVGPLTSGDTAADAIVWMGTAGTRGFSSLGKVLSGAVNPSGRLTDTWTLDFTADPAYQNFGDFKFSDLEYKGSPLSFVEYQEGVYLGYRYYETAAAVDPGFDYDAAVAFPFGHGLSYTSFDQQVTNFRADTDRVSMTVRVTNTGSVEGKEVVQAYYTSPYTDYDRTAGVEKPATNLVAFAKTDLLAPGASQDVDLAWVVDDMASWDTSHQNSDGTTGAWLLEAGDYAIDLRSDAHTVLASQVATVDEDHWFEGADPVSRDRAAQCALDGRGEATDDPKRAAGLHAAHNEFDALNAYMADPSVTNLSRADWAGTQPVAPEGRTKAAPQAAKDERAWFEGYDPTTDSYLGNVEGSKVFATEAPASGAANGLTLAGLRGVPFDDPQWDELLDQIDWDAEKDDITNLIYMANYQTSGLRSIAKPATKDRDGAMGWGGVGASGASSWASVNLLASSWNCDLMRAMGEAIGEESLHLGFSGWYAPAVNIHRCPFGGRVYEYYSEDALLSGKLAAAAISGAGDMGVFSYLKHFALNDQETNRGENLTTWAGEQAVREIYLRPFQIALEEARSTVRYLDAQGAMQEKVICSGTGVMASQSGFGGVTGACHYQLLTGVLRDEWGFDGAVVSDLSVASATGHDLALRAGCDLWLAGFIDKGSDYDSPTAKGVMRQAVHRVCYMVANSNAMNGIAPGAAVSTGTATWRGAVNGGSAGIVGLLALGWGLYVHRRHTKPDTSFEDRKARKAAKKQAKRDRRSARRASRKAKHEA